MISENLGVYFASQTAQYAIGASMAGGFSASGITIRCSSQLCLHEEPPHSQSHPLRKSKVRLGT